MWGFDGLSIRLAQDLGHSEFTGSAKGACGLGSLGPVSLHFRMQGHFDVGLQQDSGKISPASSLVGICGSSLRNSYLWFFGVGARDGGLVHSSTAPKTGSIHSFLVGCQTPGLAGPHELGSALWISLSCPNRVSGLSLYQVFG